MEASDLELIDAIDPYVHREPGDPIIQAYCDKGIFIDAMLVGSRETCDPAPTDTDEDHLCLVKSLKAFAIIADRDGFACGGSEVCTEDRETTMRFDAWRSGRINLIVTDCPEFWARFKAATSVAKRFNLLDKADRIALFQAVLYGNECDMRKASV